MHMSFQNEMQHVNMLCIHINALHTYICFAYTWDNKCHAGLPCMYVQGTAKWYRPMHCIWMIIPMQEADQIKPVHPLFHLPKESLGIIILALQGCTFTYDGLQGKACDQEESFNWGAIGNTHAAWLVQSAPVVYNHPQARSQVSQQLIKLETRFMCAALSAATSNGQF